MRAPRVLGGLTALAIVAVALAAIFVSGGANRGHGRPNAGCPVQASPAPDRSAPAWPAPLSASRQRAPIASSAGGGIFGQWLTDGAGLPAYAFTGPRAALARASIGGRAEGWSLLGNDHVNALASTTGAVELWSEDRRNEFVNRADPAGHHYSGGFGYLRTGGQTYSTLTADAGARAGLQFGIGYVRRCRQAGDIAVDEHVYAPFGDDPVLLHDVVLRNPGPGPIAASWTEYWDVNPYDQPLHQPITTGAPRWDAGRRLLVVPQAGGDADEDPLEIFAAALNGPVTGFDTDANRFFGRGGRAAPAGVAAARAGDTLASAGAPAVLVLRAAVRIPAHGSVRLRYAFGAAHSGAVPRLLQRYASGDPLTATERAWSAYVPQVHGIGGPALAREAQWAAASVREASTYEEACGHHVLAQGGAYLYGLGLQIALRDPLQHALAMVPSDPSLALDVLRYAAALQDRRGALPFGTRGMCQAVPDPGSGDLDVWLLLLAAEYGLATRDRAAFDAPVPFRGGGQASLWEHLQRAVGYQESLRGPHGGYRTPSGDWSDASHMAIGMTESALIPAQLAYIYPRLAELAELRGDSGVAHRLQRLGLRCAVVVARAFTPAGWVQRGWAGVRPLGRGVLYLEPQPWALLSGVARGAQATRLVSAIGSELTRGSPIGTPQAPAASDPRVHERGQSIGGAGDGAATYPGGVWYAADGWLTWGLARSGVPHAGALALGELQRNTLAAHATAYPRAWSGILSVDDACAAFYAPHPDRCGIGADPEYDALNLHQPAWLTWDLFAVAGIEPTAAGYRFTPILPGGHYELRMALAGIQSDGARLRGYVRPVGSGSIQIEVCVPFRGRAAARVDERSVRAQRHGCEVSFTARAPGHGGAVDWSVGPA